MEMRKGEDEGKKITEGSAQQGLLALLALNVVAVRFLHLNFLNC